MYMYVVYVCIYAYHNTYMASLLADCISMYFSVATNAQDVIIAI